MLTTPETLREIAKTVSPLYADMLILAALELTALQTAGRAVVDARYYHGDDGWDKLKNAIADLECKVGRS